MRFIYRILALSALVLLMVQPADARKKAPQEPKAKYVFYMIGDGMGVNEAYGTMLYNRATGFGPETINFTQFQTKALVTTFCASSLVTDSAAAGSALASGSKVNYGAMGQTPDGANTSTLAENAKAAGFGAGVISSVGVNHATPAAFYAHIPSRNDYDAIAMQLISSNVDFCAGGGFNLERKSGHDTQFYVDEAAKAGIGVYLGKDALKNVDLSKRAICIPEDFAHNEIPYAIDRKPGDLCLLDYTNAAIDYLYANFKQGFFLMIEGGSIDHGGHDNDAATTFQEVNDFAASVDAVLAFYEQHPEETLIVITADHETGGLMLGAGKYEMNPGLLKAQTASKGVLTSKVSALAAENREVSWEEVKTLLSDCLGLWTLVPVDSKTEERFKELYTQTFVNKNAQNVMGWYSTNTLLVTEAVKYLDTQAGYGWISGAHSGSPVGAYVKGVREEEFKAANDNTDLPKLIRKVAGY